jgi:hypothetical protein
MWFRIVCMVVLCAPLCGTSHYSRSDDKKPKEKQADKSVYELTQEAYQYPKAKAYSGNIASLAKRFAAGYAKYQTDDAFDDVVKWYAKKFRLSDSDGFGSSGSGDDAMTDVTHNSRIADGSKDRPISLWVATARYYKSKSKGYTATIVVSQVKGEKMTDILVSIIADKTEKDD